MLTDHELAEFDRLCSAIYSENSSEAHQVLLPLISNIQHIPQFRALILQTTQPLSTLFGASGLLMTFTQSWNVISDEEKSETKSAVLTYLFNKAPDLLGGYPQIVLTVVRLFVRLTKLSWMEDINNQNLIDQVTPFFQSSKNHGNIGLSIYTEITHDMQPQAGRNANRMRRTSSSFRDGPLSQILQSGILYLKGFQSSGGIGVGDDVVLQQVLQLNHNCMSFDYHGTILDETAADQHIVMLPQWGFIKEEKLPVLYGDIYNLCWGTPPRADCGRLALQCLILAASLRKSFYAREDEKLDHLNQLVMFTTRILETKTGLGSADCYHEMCRLLSKIASNYPLGELAKLPTYNTWVERVYDFTVSSLRDITNMPNSKFYLMSIWSHIVASTKDTPHSSDLLGNLADRIQQIAILLLDSRMTLADHNRDNPEDTDVTRMEFLDVLSNMSTVRYHEIATHLGNIFDVIHASSNTMSRDIFESKLTWLVYMIGAVVKGSFTMTSRRMGGYSHDSCEDVKVNHSMVAAQLVLKVFNLMSETGQWIVICESLELALLYFLAEFRRVYSGENASSPGLSMLTQTLAPNSEPGTAVVYDLVVQKIVYNLRKPGMPEAVIKSTLDLLEDMAASIQIVTRGSKGTTLVVSGKDLLTSPTLLSVLGNHRSDLMVFLTAFPGGKFRTPYYNVISQCLFTEFQERKTFASFMTPFEEAFNQLATVQPTSPSVKLPLTYLMRDLRGVCQAANPESYPMFFEWMTSKFTDVNPELSRMQCLSNVAVQWAEDVDVCIVHLKFVSELVYNKRNRISFPPNHAGGIVLFKEATGVVFQHNASQVLNRQVPRGEDMYKYKTKPMAVLLEIFNRTVLGEYVNFGVFDLYHDPTLTNAIRYCFSLCLSTPADDLQSYEKIQKPYYQFLETACHSFPRKVLEVPPADLAKLIRTVEEGLCSDIGSQTYIHCATIIDEFCKYLFETIEGTDPLPKANACRFLEEQPLALVRILRLLFNFLVIGELHAVWVVAKPLLGLIILHEKEFLQLRDGLYRQFSPARAEELAMGFKSMMSSVELNQSDHNRSEFPKKLYNLSHIIRGQRK